MTSLHDATDARTFDNSSFVFDHLEFWVGNAKQAAHFYASALGFDVIAYAGPETGRPGRASYVLAQDRIRIVLTSPLVHDDEMVRAIGLHGDGVRDVAFAVADATAAHARAVAMGARSVAAPAVSSDEQGEVLTATIATYGDTVHTFIERRGYRGAWLPGFVPHATVVRAPQATGLAFLDHCVANVGWNEMERWCAFYARTLGFIELVGFDDKDISTEFTALRSKVMQNATGAVKLPINEPATGKKRSQIEEYLDFNCGPGVQHIAIATEDIVSTVRALRANGVELLSTPDSYYVGLAERVGVIEEDIAILRELSILVDRDDRGYMLQIFTKPLQDRPTVFFEIIQRKGALSFGKGNFKALFVSIEREQARRGTL